MASPGAIESKQASGTDTHILEKRGWVASARANESKQAQALTNWRRDDRQHQQEQLRASKNKHSHSEEGRMGSFSKGN